MVVNNSTPLILGNIWPTFEVGNEAPLTLAFQSLLAPHLNPTFLKAETNKQGWTFLCKSRAGENSNSSPSPDLTDTSKDDIKPDRHFTPLISQSSKKATSKGTGSSGKGSSTKGNKDDCPQHGLYDSLVKWLFWSIPDLNQKYQTSFTKDSSSNLVYINYALSNPDSYCQFFNLSFNIFTFKINN